MAKSKIVKELADSSASLETALKRLIVLLQDFDKPELLQWAKNELTGYSDETKVPSYREFEGVVMGNFIVGNAYKMMRYTNHTLPINTSDQKLVDAVRNVRIHQSISSLQKAVQEKSQLSKLIPIEMANYLVKDTNIAGVTSAFTRIDILSLQDILSTVEEKLLEIFILLDKEFGNLDELDIDFTTKNNEQLSSIIQQIYVIIFEDKSITIGDQNEITKSDISTQ